MYIYMCLYKQVNEARNLFRLFPSVFILMIAHKFLHIKNVYFEFFLTLVKFRVVFN